MADRIRFKKFSHIGLEDLLTDFHIHTAWTDGKGTVAEVVEEANRLNLKEIAFADHIRRSSDYFQAYREEVRRIARGHDLLIHVGFECKIAGFDGQPDVAPEVWDKADIRIVSVHRFPLGRKLFEPSAFSKTVCQEIEMELSLSALKRGDVDVLGHPGGMSLENHGGFPDHSFEEIMDACRRTGTAFELNYFYHRTVFKTLVHLLRKHDPYVSFGSDAHEPKDIGAWRQHKEDFLG